MANLKTTLHRYSFDTSRKSEREAWLQLCARLEQTNGRCFNVIADPRNDARDVIPEGAIELELEHIFADQWNSTTHRVFDWYEGIYPNCSIKSGHYLDITDEMREIRRNTYACGYCGKQYPAATGLVFCDQCLDSPYLKTEDLHLLRMVSCDQLFPRRAPLADAERAHLMPQYIERQTRGNASRAVQAKKAERTRILRSAEKKIASAATERDGMIWLLDRGFSVENVIYYEHTDRFCFGWRTPVSDEVASELLKVVSEFPHAYTIVGTSRKWESCSE